MAGAGAWAFHRLYAAGGELFPGTVAENIARLDPFADDGMIIAAAQRGRRARHHCPVSGWCARRASANAVSVSRPVSVSGLPWPDALYGDPFLVVLDEPNSNLDTEGRASADTGDQGVRARGGIVIVVAHRTGILGFARLCCGDGRRHNPRLRPARCGHQTATKAAAPPLKVIEGEAVAHEA